MVEADALCHFGGSGQVEVTERIDVQALDGLRMFLGDFLDFGAAVGGGQHVEVARGAVHGDGHVVFVQDVLASATSTPETLCPWMVIGRMDSDSRIASSRLWAILTPPA